MPLTIGLPQYSATIYGEDALGNSVVHKIELVGSSPAVALANGKRWADRLNLVSGLKFTKLRIEGRYEVTGDDAADYGHFRNYQAWIGGYLDNGKQTTIKIPGHIESLLLVDRKNINLSQVNLAIFLNLFKPMGIARLRYGSLQATLGGISRHAVPKKGQTIRIGGS
jgi:hypothetical protein